MSVKKPSPPAGKVQTLPRKAVRAPAAKPLIKLCRAEACQARGVDALAPQFESDDRIEVETVYCLGLCASGPAAMVGERVFARLDKLSAARLIEEVA